MADQLTEQNIQQPDSTKIKFPRYLAWSWIIWGLLGVVSFVILYSLSSSYLNEVAQKKQVSPSLESIEKDPSTKKENLNKKLAAKKAIIEEEPVTLKTVNSHPTDDSSVGSNAILLKSSTPNEKAEIAVEPTSSVQINTQFFDGTHTINITWDKIQINQADANGNPLKMSMYIAAKELSWKFESTEFIKYQKRAININRYFRSDDFISMIKKSESFVCVGTASEEGYRIIEEGRAMERADQLAAWVQNNNPDMEEVYTLNLGQFYGENDKFNPDVSLTEYQRRVILISITPKSSNILLEQALIKTLSTLKSLPVHPDDYSRFSLNRANQSY